MMWYLAIFFLADIFVATRDFDVLALDVDGSGSFSRVSTNHRGTPDSTTAAPTLKTAASSPSTRSSTNSATDVTIKTTAKEEQGTVKEEAVHETPSASKKEQKSEETQDEKEQDILDADESACPEAVWKSAFSNWKFDLNASHVKPFTIHDGFVIVCDDNGEIVGPVLVAPRINRNDPPSSKVMVYVTNNTVRHTLLTKGCSRPTIRMAERDSGRENSDVGQNSSGGLKLMDECFCRFSVRKNRHMRNLLYTAPWGLGEQVVQWATRLDQTNKSNEWSEQDFLECLFVINFLLLLFMVAKGLFMLCRGVRHENIPMDVPEGLAVIHPDEILKQTIIDCGKYVADVVLYVCPLYLLTRGGGQSALIVLTIITFPGAVANVAIFRIVTVGLRRQLFFSGLCQGTWLRFEHNLLDWMVLWVFFGTSVLFVFAVFAVTSLVENNELTVTQGGATVVAVGVAAGKSLMTLFTGLKKEEDIGKISFDLHNFLDEEFVVGTWWTSAKTQVLAAAHPDGEVLSELPSGTKVFVEEVERCEDELVRGRISNPDGWIPLWSMRTAEQWARKNEVDNEIVSIKVDLTLKTMQQSTFMARGRAGMPNPLGKADTERLQRLTVLKCSDEQIKERFYPISWSDLDWLMHLIHQQGMAYEGTVNKFTAKVIFFMMKLVPAGLSIFIAGIALSSVLACILYIAFDPSLDHVNSMYGEVSPAFSPQVHVYGVLSDAQAQTDILTIANNPYDIYGLEVTTPQGNSRITESSDSQMILISNSSYWPGKVNWSMSSGMYQSKYTAYYRPTKALFLSVMVTGQVNDSDKIVNFKRCIPWPMVANSAVSVPDSIDNLTMEIAVVSSEYGIPRACTLGQCRNISDSDDALDITTTWTKHNCVEECIFSPRCLSYYRTKGGCYRQMLKTKVLNDQDACEAMHYRADTKTSALADSAVHMFLGNRTPETRFCIPAHPLEGDVNAEAIGKGNCQVFRNVSSNRFALPDVEDRLKWNKFNTGHSVVKLRLGRFGGDMETDLVTIQKGKPMIWALLTYTDFGVANVTLTFKEKDDTGPQTQSISIRLPPYDAREVGTDVGGEKKKLVVYMAALVNAPGFEAAALENAAGSEDENIFTNVTDTINFPGCKDVKSKTFTVCGGTRGSRIFKVHLDPWQPMDGLQVKIVDTINEIIGIWEDRLIPITITTFRDESPYQRLARKNCTTQEEAKKYGFEEAKKCSLAEKDRMQCGQTGITERECELKSCCYRPSTKREGIPHCYLNIPQDAGTVEGIAQLAATCSHKDATITQEVETFLKRHSGTWDAATVLAGVGNNSNSEKFLNSLIHGDSKHHHLQDFAPLQRLMFLNTNSSLLKRICNEMVVQEHNRNVLKDQDSSIKDQDFLHTRQSILKEMGQAQSMARYIQSFDHTFMPRVLKVGEACLSDEEPMKMIKEIWHRGSWHSALAAFVSLGSDERMSESWGKVDTLELTTVPGLGKGSYNQQDLRVLSIILMHVPHVKTIYLNECICPERSNYGNSKGQQAAGKLKLLQELETFKINFRHCKRTGQFVDCFSEKDKPERKPWKRVEPIDRNGCPATSGRDGKRFAGWLFKEFAKALATLPRLKWLQFSNANLGSSPESGKKAKKQPASTRIARLVDYSHRSDLVDNWAESMAQLKLMNLSLEVLDFSQNAIRDSAFTLLAETLPHLTRLKKLIIPGNQFKSHGLIELGKIAADMKQLEVLDLCRNAITIGDKEHLEKIVKNMAGLTSLKLLAPEDSNFKKVDGAAMDEMKNKLKELRPGLQIHAVRPIVKTPAPPIDDVGGLFGQDEE